MKTREKARELVEKFKPMCHNVKHTGILNGLATVINDDIINFYAAKQCALIAVSFSRENPLNTDGYNKYLDEIEKEIENF
jgi:hypothetical protein